VLNAHALETAVWLNKGNGTFVRHILPVEAQFFPVYAIVVDDFTHDGASDILLSGNQYRAKPETGIYAAGYGLLVRGDGHGNFSSVPPRQSGFSIAGEIRAFERLRLGARTAVIIGRNSSAPQLIYY
jgi:hypothetical protein